MTTGSDSFSPRSSCHDFSYSIAASSDPPKSTLSAKSRETRHAEDVIHMYMCVCVCYTATGNFFHIGATTTTTNVDRRAQFSRVSDARIFFFSIFFFLFFLIFKGRTPRARFDVTPRVKCFLFPRTVSRRSSFYYAPQLGFDPRTV